MFKIINKCNNVTLNYTQIIPGRTEYDLKDQLADTLGFKDKEEDEGNRESTSFGAHRRKSVIVMKELEDKEMQENAEND